MFLRNFACRRCERNIGEAVEQEERSCGEVETVRKFTYLGDRVSAGRGYQSSVTARAGCWWVKFRGCGELSYGWALPLRLKGAVCKSYASPAIMYGSEAWCLKKVTLEFLEGQRDLW